MAEKRKDKKGRILRDGESQRADGKYEYKYTDNLGKRHSVYSWKLVETDKTPAGKRCNESLREMEKRIRKDLDDGINIHDAKNMTLNDAFEKWIDIKTGVKENTIIHYKYIYNQYIYNQIGKSNITEIKYSDVKKFYILLTKQGLQYNSIKLINAILYPTFRMMVRDDYIRKNPAEDVFYEMKNDNFWRINERYALSEKEQKIFMKCASRGFYKKYKNLFIVLLGTGMRIGEAIGLRWKDCDFQQNIISINHTLTYQIGKSGKKEYHISTPKTKASRRIIPMLSEVKTALLEERKNQMKTGFNESVIDGYLGFIFKNDKNRIHNPVSINKAVKKICENYNKEELKTAKEKNYEPILLPYFTVHVFRHTFCTRLCEKEINLKVIQEIMGHSKISTTLEIYAKVTEEMKIKAFISLENKLKIS